MNPTMTPIQRRALILLGAIAYREEEAICLFAEAFHNEFDPSELEQVMFDMAEQLDSEV